MEQSVLTKNQRIMPPSKDIDYYGEDATIEVTLRYDDECGNGHNTFAITADIFKRPRRGRDPIIACGCMHEEIVKHFPELEKYIKWHLTSSDGPMYYLANTLYFAGTKDCHGKEKGEPYNFKHCIKFDGFPVVFRKFSKEFVKLLSTFDGWNDVSVVESPHPEDPEMYSSNYTFNNFDWGWYKAPFHSKPEAEEFLHALQIYQVEVVSVPTSFGVGKEPELEAARDAAVWPDASLEQLQSKEVLLERLPALMAEFKSDMEELGFTF